MIGRSISDYEILEELGEGMGVVYKGKDKELRRPVALEFLPPNATENRERLLLKSCHGPFSPAPAGWSAKLDIGRYPPSLGPTPSLPVIYGPGRVWKHWSPISRRAPVILGSLEHSSMPSGIAFPNGAHSTSS